MLNERMTTDEVAEYLGVSRVTLLKKWKRGKEKGPVFHKIDHNNGYYLRAEVEAFKKEHGPFRPAFTKLSDVLKPDDFDWSWATESELKELRKECGYCSARWGSDEGELFTEACLYIAARPGMLESREYKYRFQRAVEHAHASLRRADQKAKELEQAMGDEYWNIV